MDTFEDDVDEVGTILKLMIDNILKKKNQEFREMKEAFVMMKESPLFQKMFLPEKIVEENESLKNQLLGLEAELKSYRSEESINIHLKVEDIGSVDTEYKFDRKYKGVDNVISNKSVEVIDLAEASASASEADEAEVEEEDAEGDEAEVVVETEVEENPKSEEEASASEADEAETDDAEADEEEDAEEADETGSEEEASASESEVDEEEGEEEADESEADSEADEVEESEQVDTEVEASEAETEASEAGEETEASEAEEEEEVIEIEHNGITYFVTNETDGEVYECVDDDIGEQVGVIKKGKITIF